MRIFVIMKEDFTSRSLSTLFSDVDNISLLNKSMLNNCSNPIRITDFKELINCKEDKIIAISPDVIDWQLPAEDLAQIPNLKGIATRSAWMEYIDLDYCKKHKIEVRNTPNANSQAVAEYAIWMLFSLARRLTQQISINFEEKADESLLNFDIKGKTLGVIGLGNIGSKIADMASGLGMKVIYWNRSKKDVRYKKRSLEDVLCEADVVVNCLELCEGTQNLLSEDNLKLMKKTAFYITVAGGLGWGNADEVFLLKQLEKGNIAGIASENHHKEGFIVSEKVLNGNYNLFLPGTFAWFTQDSQDNMDKLWKQGVEDIVKGR